MMNTLVYKGYAINEAYDGTYFVLSPTPGELYGTTLQGNFTSTYAAKMFIHSLIG